MKRFSFRDTQLEAAAAEVCGAMLEGLPEETDCGHVFSVAFEEKMARLTAEKKRCGGARTLRRQVAAAVLAAAIGLCVWLAVDREARAAVVQWVREVYENSILYRFTGEAPESALPVYRPAWLPEGYEEASVLETATGRTLIYQNGADTFTITYHWMSQGQAGELIGTGGEGKEISISGRQGHYYPAPDSDSTNDLVLIDEKAGIAFVVSAFLDEQDILHIVESLKLDKSPN